MSSPTKELSGQWGNPTDILTLLLLIGGNIVQMAIAQLSGYKIRIPGKANLHLSIAPVAFSFGWVAYGFSNLLSAVGDNSLMPTSEFPSLVVNCANAFVRENRSWSLSRILRDHEARFEIDQRPLEDGGRAESMRIDIFNLEPPSGPSLDHVWWFGWVTVTLQIGVALIPYILYRDWNILVVVLAGNLLSAITCALPQWSQEKWAGKKLEVDKITCLTRGNGHAHVMVFIGSKGSWDLENLSTATACTRPETRWISIILAILWTCLLINVSGLKEHAWFLLASGTLGMLQNVFAAGTSRRPGASNFPLTEFSRASTIIGKRQSYAKGDDATVDLQKDLEKLADIARWASKEPAPPLAISPDTHSTPSEEIPMPRWLSSMSKDDGIPEWLEPIKPDQNDGVIYAVGVHGALIELEKWVPTAGLAMVPIFFSGGLKYRDEKSETKFTRNSGKEHTIRTM